MTGSVQSPYTQEQISIWLQGLFAIAWADGHFDDEEKELIADLTETELAPQADLDPVSQVMPEAIAATLGKGTEVAENFLRTAVMVAIVDGVYSEPEDELLHQYCVALDLDESIIESLRATLPKNQAPASPLFPDATKPSSTLDEFNIEEQYTPVLKPVQKWLDGLEIHDPQLARFLCKMIPPQCPFERDVTLFGRKIVHIPAMCKLNPMYEQLVGLRFRALSFLADDCGEDVSKYC